MKILAALGTTSQDAFVVNEVARLAGNTWADVTLLGVETGTSPEIPPFSASFRSDESHPLVQSLRGLRGRFLSRFKAEESPYMETVVDHELVEVESNLWEDLNVLRSARKQLVTRIRPGNAARSILAEARQFPCDLIVIGSSLDGDGNDIGRICRKVIHEAGTSVLVIAKTKLPQRIVACLDHDRVSQHSLEIINQMVTLYQADLEIVGVSTVETLPGEIDDKMGQILKYYAQNGIRTLVRSVPRTSLEAFAAQASRENLVALWMGRQSRLHRFITPRSMDRLLDNSDYSVLILR
ncbi:MAG: universal stress protein [Deltaproteobacteria bacterium]|nr:universal stress protein [Deltaproteobacteria bacterium]